MTVILYATRYGSTRRVAERIAEGYRAKGGSAELLEISGSTSLPDADTLVIGAPIFGGSIPRVVDRFLERELEAILERRVGLFLRCFYDGSRAEQQLADNFPARLIAHSFGNYYVGGEVEVGKLSWIDRMLMRRVAKIEHDVDKTNEGAIARLIADL